MTAHAPLPTTLCLLAAVLVGPTACKPGTKAEAPEPRPVRTVTAAEQQAGENFVLTGHIQAEDEVSLAFRISGRMIERPVNVGDRIETGQELAKLDPENEVNALRSAQAAAAAAQPQLHQRASHLRAAEHASGAGPHAARAIRPGREGAAERAGPGRRRRAQMQIAARRVSYTILDGRRPRHRDRARRGAGRGGAGRADDRHRSRARAGGTRCSTCPPAAARGTGDPRDHGRPGRRPVGEGEPAGFARSRRRPTPSRGPSRSRSA